MDHTNLNVLTPRIEIEYSIANCSTSTVTGNNAKCGDAHSFKHSDSTNPQRGSSKLLVVPQLTPIWGRVGYTTQDRNRT